VFVAVRNGERDEFDRLMETYRPLVAEIVRNQMTPRLRTVLEPDDVLQDVMLSAYRGIGEARFASESAFRGWLQVMTRNRLIDLDRRHFKTERRPANVKSLDETVHGPDGSGRRGDAVPSAGPGPSTVVGRREIAEAIEDAIAHCRPKDRELIRLVLVDRLPIPEIADRLGKKPAAVRKALSRALEACRSAFGSGPPPPRGSDAP
jgi:RNA polymerase sigma-70 factor (ECF subfamily)